MTTVPGIDGYAIGTFSSVQMIPDAKGQHHGALFRIDTPDLAAAIAAFRERAPHMTPGPMMTNLWGYTYAPPRHIRPLAAAAQSYPSSSRAKPRTAGPMSSRLSARARLAWMKPALSPQS